MKRGCDDDGNRDMVVVEGGIFFEATNIYLFIFSCVYIYHYVSSFYTSRFVIISDTHITDYNYLT